MECKHCKHVFEGGASRIREHFLHSNPACGIAKCTADEAVLQPILDEMRAIDAQNKAAAGAAAPDRQQLQRVDSRHQPPIPGDTAARSAAYGLFQALAVKLVRLLCIHIHSPVAASATGQLGS